MSDLGYEYNVVSDVRQEFADKLQAEEFTIDRLGSKTIEILGASFCADEDHIFGVPSEEYIEKEIQWYKSMSSNINDIYGEEREAPQAWGYAANKHGEINSNYGLLIFSEKYGNQYYNVLGELAINPDTRRACMVYNRPSIWNEFDEQGKSDFICTNAVTYYIRDGKLHVVVQMRSNDAWAGYRNDFAWAKYVQQRLIKDLYSEHKQKLEEGSINWQVQNLHVYQKNFYMVDHYIKTGKSKITKKEYTKLYPDSKWI